MSKLKETGEKNKELLIRARRFCFTLNNPTYSSHEDFFKLFRIGTRYMIIGDEIGEECGTPHYQGYVVFVNATCIARLKKLDDRVHWEITKSNHHYNIVYCSKDKNYTEFGERPKGQGARTDLKSMTAMIDNGSSTREILLAYEDRALRVLGNIEKARKYLSELRREWVMDVRIYWGAPGTGKTRAVWDEFTDIYPKMVGKWWDGYEGQEVVLIDDFDPSNCYDITYDFYLKLLDRYPMQVEVKGGTREFTSKVIIFTSNYSPLEWFNTKRHNSAFFRRIREIRHYIGNGIYNDDDMMPTAQNTEVDIGNTREVSISTSGDRDDDVVGPQRASAIGTCVIPTTAQPVTNKRTTKRIIRSSSDSSE